MTVRAFADTNVLVYAFDTSDSEKQSIAQDILGRASPSEIVLSAQVLNEFWVTVTGKLARPLPVEDASRVVADLVASFEVVPVDAGLVLAGIDRHRNEGLALWDALVVEAARASDCTMLLTEDLTHGQDHDGVAIHNPFRELS